MADRTITTDIVGRNRLSPALNEAGRDAEQAGGKLKTFGKGLVALGAGAGAAAGGLLAKGFADNLDIEKGNAKLAAQLDLSKGEADKAGKIAGEVYADNWGESTEQINDALKAVDVNLGDVGKTSSAELKAMTEDALILAGTFDKDVNESTAAAGALIKNGLAKNSAEAFDIITAGFQNGVNKADDFTDTLTEYSPQFKKLGFDGKYALDLISEGLKAGARDTDVIADGFKEFGLRAIDGSKTTVKAYKDIGLNADKTAAAIAKGGPGAQKAFQQVLDSLVAIKDPIKQNNAGVALFGTTWEDTIRQILPALANADGAIEKVDGSTQRAGDTIGNTAAGKIETAKRKFEQWTQSMASSDGALGLVGTSVAEFGGGAVSAAGQVGILIVGLKGTAAAGAVASVASSGMTAAFGAMKVAATLALGPWGLVVLGIIALGVALVTAYKKSETFRAVVNSVFKATANLVLQQASLWIGAFEGIFHVLGKLPGKAGAAFRSAERGAAAAKRKIDDMRASINAVKSKNVRLTVTTVFYQKGKEPGTAGNGLGVIAPGRAVGGMVAKGQPYVVGERRAELFVPEQNGTIIPDVSAVSGSRFGQTGGGAWGGGGGDTYIINVSALGDQQVGDTVVRALKARPAGAAKIPASAVARG